MIDASKLPAVRDRGIEVEAAQSVSAAPQPNDQRTYVAQPRNRAHNQGAANFTPKRWVEIELFTVDFAPLLVPGETLVNDSAAWTISPISGADPAAALMIVGEASIDGATSSQLIGSGVPGLRYAPVCTVRTSGGRTLALPEYGQGHIEITL